MASFSSTKEHVVLVRLLLANVAVVRRLLATLFLESALAGPTQYDKFEEISNKLGKMQYETDEIIVEQLRQRRLEEIRKEKEEKQEQEAVA